MLFKKLLCLVYVVLEVIVSGVCGSKKLMYLVYVVLRSYCAWCMLF